MAGSGSTYATDDDPELVRDAVPFGLKTMEGVLAEKPRHRGLLTALASGFTQYAYAFVQSDADAADLDGRLYAARAGRARARKLFLRARDYGLRGLEVAPPAAGRPAQGRARPPRRSSPGRTGMTSRCSTGPPPPGPSPS